MNTFLIILVCILVAAVIIAGCLHVYRSAELHELHKIRAAFDNAERRLLSKIESEVNTLSHDGIEFGTVSKDAIQGAGYAAQELFKWLKYWEEKEEKEISHEFVNHIKKTITDAFHGKE